MARIKNAKSQRIRFKDFADFAEAISDMDLTDIINDTAKEKVSDDFISAPGAFVYELDLLVDEKKVRELEVLGFKVELFSSNPKQRLKKETHASRRWSAKAHKRRTREFIETYAPSPFMSFNVDLNVKLPPASFQFLTKNLFIPKPKPVPVYFNTAPLTSNNFVSTKITALPTTYFGSPAIKFNAGKTSSFKSVAKQAIMNFGNDPAAMMASPTPVFPTLSAKISPASVPVDYPPAEDQLKRISIDSIYVRRSLVSEREKMKKQVVDNSPPAVKMSAMVENNVIDANKRVSLGHKAEIQSTLFSVRREIEVSKKFLGMSQKFWVKITPNIRKSQSLIKIEKLGVSTIFSVDHREKVSDMLIPEYAPEITLLKDRKGIVILAVDQKDPAATSVSVVKRVVSPRKEKISEPREIQTIKMEAESPRAVITDYDAENIFPNIVIYRAISKSPGGAQGPSTSLVVKGHYNVNVPTAKEDPNELSIVAVNENTQIRVEVERIPEEVIGISLMKEEIDETGSLSDRVYVVPAEGGKTLSDTFGGVTKLTYLDRDVELNRRYRYFCSMRPRLGNDFISEEDEHIIRKMPITPLPVEVSLENSQVTVDDNGHFVVSVDALSIPKPEGVDFLLSVLENSGISKIYIDEIRKQKAQFANLAVFIVERVDRVSGRRVSFGLNGAGTFEDGPTKRRFMKIPPPQPGRRYTYFFKLCLRPPLSFLKGAFANFSSGKEPGIDDKKALAQKFLSAYSSLGGLPSAKDMDGGVSVGDSFRSGETGIVLRIDVKTPKPKPLPTNLRLYRRARKSVALRWEVTGGDIREVDHCMIFVKHKGQTVLLGTRSCNGRNNIFHFREKKYYREIGEKNYFVKLVYTDLQISEESNIASIVRHASLPIAYFAKYRRLRLLGVVKSKKRKLAIVKKNRQPRKFDLSTISKNMGAPGWNFNPKNSKKF